MLKRVQLRGEPFYTGDYSSTAVAVYTVSAFISRCGSGVYSGAEKAGRGRLVQKWRPEWLSTDCDINRRCNCTKAVERNQMLKALATYYHYRVVRKGRYIIIHNNLYFWIVLIMGLNCEGRFILRSVNDYARYQLLY